MYRPWQVSGTLLCCTNLRSLVRCEPETPSSVYGCLRQITLIYWDFCAAPSFHPHLLSASFRDWTLSSLSLENCVRAFQALVLFMVALQHQFFCFKIVYATNSLLCWYNKRYYHSYPWFPQVARCLWETLVHITHVRRLLVAPASWNIKRPMF